jgi:hypothetical protein
MPAQKRLICVVASAVRRFSCGLVAAAMIWSLKLTCHWHELGTSLWVRGGGGVADQARRDREAPAGGGPGGPLSGRVAIVTGAAGGLGSSAPPAHAASDDRPPGPRDSLGRQEVIIANSMQDQEGRRARPGVRHPVRPKRENRAP